MTQPTRHNVGDKIIITPKNLEIMRDSNRSCVHPNCPSDDFIEKASRCASRDGVGLIGEVTHTFPPGYEITARFGERSFHVKDHWVTPLTAAEVRIDLIGKLAAENAKDLSDAEIERVFGNAVLSGFCIDQITRARDAGVTLEQLYAAIEPSAPSAPQP